MSPKDLTFVLEAHSFQFSSQYFMSSRNDFIVYLFQTKDVQLFLMLNALGVFGLILADT